jgi:hypothetical protein
MLCNAKRIEAGIVASKAPGSRLTVGFQRISAAGVGERPGPVAARGRPRPPEAAGTGWPTAPPSLIAR